ncbi:MAG TPA: ATP12 family protein [Microvirga sp.]|jgi:chaperone required for assembly of F1-ATPase
MSDQFPSDWFPSPEEPNPMRSAQAGMKPALPKRFYKEAGVEERDGAFQLVLDGRPARTPGRQPLAVPTRALAEALAAEWDRQAEEVNPATMPLTRIVNSALDGVAVRRDEVVDDLVRYAGSDLVCYRAAEPARLVEAQNRAWNPVLDWMRDKHGARFTLSEGVMHVSQPDAATQAVRAAIQPIASPLKLAALHVMTTLTGSVLIALAHAQGRFTVDEAWAAAHADEIYQESVWGEDHEAMVRRETREAEFQAASQVFALGG